MSFQRTARLRHFITAQTCRYQCLPWYSSRDIHVFPPTTTHTHTFRHLAQIPETHRRPTADSSLNRPPSGFFASGISQSATRRYATAAAEVGEPGTSRTAALLVALPKREQMDPEEEVELLGEDEARIQLTERAAEKLRAISAGENDPSLALRIAVESGGCHGYQYKMELTSQPAPDDYQFTHPTHRPASIVVDAVSLGLLKGSTVDYATELIGSSFRVVDNPQAKGSGCGCGISWEAKF